MSRKDSAASFLKLAGLGSVDEAYARYVALDFIHHNAYFPGDRESLKAAMIEAHRRSPNRLVDVKRTFEDGDFVITHSRIVRSAPDEPDFAVVHIFRFEGDRIVEAWDVGQALSPDSPNENGIF